MDLVRMASPRISLKYDFTSYHFLPFQQLRHGRNLPVSKSFFHWLNYILYFHAICMRRKCCVHAINQNICGSHHDLNGVGYDKAICPQIVQFGEISRRTSDGNMFCISPPCVLDRTCLLKKRGHKDGVYAVYLISDNGPIAWYSQCQ